VLDVPAERPFFAGQANVDGGGFNRPLKFGQAQVREIGTAVGRKLESIGCGDVDIPSRLLPETV
jgi:hypothetical protein